ncbi:MAG: hypothetical protein ABUL68_02895 [Pseudomonadota bacterium]
MGEDPAAQKSFDLGDDERGKDRRFGGGPQFGQEGLPVRLNGPEEHRVFGLVTGVIPSGVNRVGACGAFGVPCTAGAAAFFG